MSDDVQIVTLPDLSGGEAVLAVEIEERQMRLLDGTPITAKVIRPIFLGHRP